MVAKGKDVTRHILGEEGLPKYVHHPEFQYAASSREFLDGVDEQIEAIEQQDRSGEAKLFRAMHYCAFRAWQARGKRVAVTAAAARWIKLRKRIRDRLIMANLGLCYDMTRHTRFTNVDEDDLFSEAQRALCDAVEAFDPWRGYCFSTYACNAIYRGFLRLSKMETRRARFVSFGFDLRLDTGKLDPALSDLDERVYRQRLASLMESNEAGLTDQEQDILTRRFPETSDKKRDTLARIGRDLSVCKERVRQIQMSALAKLHTQLVAEPILS
ncbi:MAG: sigma-70 family RNA polymerase sigma factor [Phycisphaerales bacterium]|nr:sigma-70 family RNA polymerase sigma factor [Phycisphaerales bacterium]